MIDREVCSQCGLPGSQGGHGYLITLHGLHWDSTGKSYPEGGRFHGYHTIVIGEKCRDRLQIPNEITEMTVAELKAFELEYRG